ncbi:MAG: hypothetical protein JEZ12_13185 [Desulfobacterium sp.]|nr:hypothetical protein [Desulfobacterium sp.]
MTDDFLETCPGCGNTIHNKENPILCERCQDDLDGKSEADKKPQETLDGGQTIAQSMRFLSVHKAMGQAELDATSLKKIGSDIVYTFSDKSQLMIIPERKRVKVLDRLGIWIWDQWLSGLSDNEIIDLLNKNEGTVYIPAWLGFHHQPDIGQAQLWDIELGDSPEATWWTLVDDRGGACLSDGEKDEFRLDDDGEEDIVKTWERASNFIAQMADAAEYILDVNERLSLKPVEDLKTLALWYNQEVESGGEAGSYAMALAEKAIEDFGIYGEWFQDMEEGCCEEDLLDDLNDHEFCGHKAFIEELNDQLKILVDLILLSNSLQNPATKIMTSDLLKMCEDIIESKGKGDQV